MIVVRWCGGSNSKWRNSMCCVQMLKNTRQKSASTVNAFTWVLVLLEEGTLVFLQLIDTKRAGFALSSSTAHSYSSLRSLSLSFLITTFFFLFSTFTCHYHCQCSQYSLCFVRFLYSLQAYCLSWWCLQQDRHTKTNFLFFPFVPLQNTKKVSSSQTIVIVLVVVAAADAIQFDCWRLECIVRASHSGVFLCVKRILSAFHQTMQEIKTGVSSSS